MSLHGAICQSNSGSGNLNETVDHPPGGVLTYEWTATALLAEGEVLTKSNTGLDPVEYSETAAN